MFRDYLVRRPYSQVTSETDSLARFFSFQSCTSHVGRMFRDYLVRRPYSQVTRETDSLARFFNFQSCTSHVATLWVSFSRNSLDLQLSLSLHQLNTKPNTIKSHKIQGNKLKKLQHFLSWNKANIKYSCKSQLYNLQDQLNQLCNGKGDPLLKGMAQRMKLKYDKYWKSVDRINLMLFVAVMVDPRY